MDLIDKNRNFGLDVIRAISISLVIYSHFGGPLAFECGVIGVEFFFVLSGFLIGQILYKSFAVKEEVSKQDLFNFWKRRWWRTLPLYYLIIIGTYVLSNFAIGKNIFYYVFFLQNHFYGVSFYPVTWSLVIEEWFYLVVPLLLYLFYRIKPPFIGVINFLIGFILFVFVFKMLFVYVRDTPFSGIRASVPLRLDTLCFGVLLAFLKNLKPAFYDKLKKPVYGLLSLMLVPLMFYLIYGARTMSSYVDLNVYLRVLWFSILSLLIFLLIPFFETSPFINENLKRIKFIFLPLTLTSILTYSIYLIHMPVISVFHQYGGGLPFQPLFKVLFIYSIAFLLYRFYEHPMTNLRDRAKKKEAHS